MEIGAESMTLCSMSTMHGQHDGLQESSDLVQGREKQIARSFLLLISKTGTEIQASSSKAKLVEEDGIAHTHTNARTLTHTYSGINLVQ